MFKTIKSIYESILITIHEHKEARLYRKWIRSLEDERHARMIEEAEQLASRPAYRPIASNVSTIELKRAA